MGYHRFMNIEHVIRENIGRTVHLSLGTVSDNMPWVVEVHFAYDDKLNLYFRSLRSRRHSQDIEHNPHVAGDIIDKFAVGEPVTGVYFEGTAQMLEKGDEQRKAFELLRDRIKIGEAEFEDAQHEDGRQFYKITVANWYAFARINDQPEQKYTLEWNRSE
jgi:uncharacterized protein YhbP (UPF0306 family)